MTSPEQVMKAAASPMVVQPRRRASSKSSAPMAWPTRTAPASEMPRGTMNVVAAQVSVI